jgi:hypothetical protein
VSWRRRRRAIRIPIREIGGRVAVPVMTVAELRAQLAQKEIRCGA